MELEGAGCSWSRHRSQGCWGRGGYKLCPSLLELCDPVYNPFSFDGTMVIYSTNALIQNMMDHGTQIKR